MTKTTCKKQKKIYGFVSITDKGQLAIPIELRRELDINKGDKLIVVKRKDGQGINLIKATALDEFINSKAK
jgi:AbrB family looped-hinge helix DNA binding protein